MRTLLLVPSFEGLDDYVESFSEHNEMDIDVRHHFENAKKSIRHYDAVVAFQSLNLSLDELEELQDVLEDKTLIVVLSSDSDESFESGLFYRGIYSGLRSSDSDVSSIIKLIDSPRARHEAKAYYRVREKIEGHEKNQILTDDKMERFKLEVLSGNYSLVLDALTKEQILFFIKFSCDEVKEKLRESEDFKLFFDHLESDKKDKTEIIEISKKREVKIESTVVQTLSNKKKILAVTNSELSSELAFMAAKISQSDVLLIDAHPVSPCIHEILGFKDSVNEDISFERLLTSSSFLQAYELASKKQLDYNLLKGVCVRDAHEKKLHVLTGSDEPTRENYEFKTFKRIIDIASDIFPLIIVNIPKDFYFSLSLYTISRPDVMTLYDFDGTFQGLKNALQEVKFLERHQPVNVKYVSFEERAPMPKEDLSQLAESKYLGGISAHPLRDKSRNDFLKSYAAKMNKKNQSEIIKILKKLGVREEKSGFRRFFS